MFNIEISNDSANLPVRDILLEDYHVVRNLHRRLVDKLPEGLTTAEIEDKIVYERTLEGFNIILEYYLDRETYLVAVGKDGG